MTTSNTFTADTMTKHERSILLYLECCAVDAGGLVESVRMNADDFANIPRLQSAGLLRFGRINSSLLEEGRHLASARGGAYNHWVELTDAGFALACDLRKLRAKQRGPFATKVFKVAAHA